MRFHHCYCVALMIQFVNRTVSFAHRHTHSQTQHIQFGWVYYALFSSWFEFEWLNMWSSISLIDSWTSRLIPNWNQNLRSSRARTHIHTHTRSVKIKIQWRMANDEECNVCCYGYGNTRLYLEQQVTNLKIE